MRGVLGVVVTLSLSVHLSVGCNREQQPREAREEYRPPTPPIVVPSSPVETRETWISTDVTELTDAYDKNEVAADLKYKGKKLLVRGKVKSIDKDLFDSIEIRLVTPKRGILVTSATLQPSSAAAAAELSKGQDVLLLCVGKGKLMDHPVLDECLIQ